MNQQQTLNETTLYYQQILRTNILSAIKNGKQSTKDLKKTIWQSFFEQGYEVSEKNLNMLNLWLSHIIDLKYIKDILNNCHDKRIEEIIIHSNEWIQVFGSERVEFYKKFLNQEDYQLSLELFALRENILWNENTPFQSIQCEFAYQMWRATLTHPAIGPSNMAKFFLRSQKKEVFKLDQFNLTVGHQQLLEQIVNVKKNIVVTGSTGSGKTSFLRALLNICSQREHITILEDTSEISLDSPFVTKLLAQNKSGFTLKDYCQYSLRLRPDRLILGEIRSDEVVPFLLSINTGHGGTMASLHANSALDALSRFCLLFQVYSSDMGVQYQEVLKLVCSGIDFIIHLENKQVKQIIEVKGSEGLTPFYKDWS